MIRFAELDVVELIGRLAESRIVGRGLNHGFDGRGEPGLGNDDDGQLVADLTSGDGNGVSFAVALDTLHRLLTEIRDYDIAALLQFGKRYRSRWARLCIHPLSFSVREIRQAACRFLSWVHHPEAVGGRVFEKDFGFAGDRGTDIAKSLLAARAASAVAIKLA